MDEKVYNFSQKQVWLYAYKKFNLYCKVDDGIKKYPFKSCVHIA